MRQTVEAELTWTGRRFERGIRLAVENGVIDSTTSAEPTDRPLQRRALIPGMISAHSHAFQRGLRGLGERFPAGAGSFWTWREAMYRLVEELDSERFLDLCTRTFTEMLAAGITTVGEFNYFHHSLGTSSRGDWAFDELVLEAARRTGIRIVLLQAMYAAGGIGVPPSPAQMRFFCDDPSEYWSRLDRLGTFLTPGQSLGVVAHSIRAVTPDMIRELHAGAKSRAMPFHMHLEEQRQEIADCIAAYGATPTRLLLDALEPGEEFTSVHATHTDVRDLAQLLGGGASVCLAPLTEGNLADGFPAVEPLLAHSGRIALGTDSNSRISMLEEMRALEYAHRLRSEQRGVWRDPDGNVAGVLFGMATRGGARSLGVPAGEIAPGRLADLVAIDLDHPSLAGVEDENVLDAWIFGAPDDTIREVCVGGNWVR